MVENRAGVQVQVYLYYYSGEMVAASKHAYIGTCRYRYLYL